MEILAHIWDTITSTLQAWNLIPNFVGPQGVFCILVWLSTILGFGLFLLSLVGGIDGDADMADAGDMDGDMGHFSVRTVVGFMLGFSWTGFLCLQNGLSLPLSLLLACAVGLASFFAILVVIRAIMSLRSDGTMQYETLVGMKGTVYVTLPPHGASGGQVQIAHPSQLITMAAIQHGDHALPAQTRVEVIEASSSLVVVREIKD